MLWNRGALSLVGANSAAGYFGINAGGLIQQPSGSTLSAASAEFDTMRATTLGRATLVNTGASTSDSVVGGNLVVTSTAGTARVNASYTVNVNGDASFNGAAGVQLLGTVRQGGNVVQNGVVTNAAGAAIAEVVITGPNAVVTASGSSAQYLLTPAVVAQLTAAGVTSVAINLGNTTTTYSTASLAPQALLLDGANTVSGNWTVRTGSASSAPPITNTRQYSLTDGGSALNLGAMDLTVNAAKGTAFTAGSQAGTVLAATSAANTAAGFDAANGSSVTLAGLQTSGVQSVKDAYDVTLNSRGTVNAGYVYANRDLSLVAGSTAGKNLNTSGALRAGRNLIGVAGMDVNLNAGTSIAAANGRVTLVADETAGIAADASVYVAGAGKFDSPEVWYKTALVLAEVVPVLQETLVNANCLRVSEQTGRIMRNEYGAMDYFAKTTYLPALQKTGASSTLQPANGGDCNASVADYPAVNKPQASRNVVMTPAVFVPKADVPAKQALRSAHRVTISADSLFAFDKSDLKDLPPEGRAKVERLVREVNKSFVNVTQVLVIGHTDRLNGHTYNLALSCQRAETVRALLVSSGMDSGLIRTAGRGKTEPLLECANAGQQALRGCLQPNRRVSIDISGDVKD